MTLPVRYDAGQRKAEQRERETEREIGGTV